MMLDKYEWPVDYLDWKPGRELDALVARKIMGWFDIGHDTSIDEWMGRPSDYDAKKYGQMYVGLPHYSTDIAAAWEVLKKMINTTGPDGDYYDVVLDIHKHRTICVMGELADYRVQVTADTTEHAICLAALETMRKRR